MVFDVRAELFLRAALVALDEVGDPTRVRAGIEAALKKPEPVRQVPRPAGTIKRVGWTAAQLAMFADDPARAYMRLRELVGELFEPIAGQRRVAAPAPEVALTLAANDLLDALVPKPRVLARDLAIAAGLDSASLLVNKRAERRILGARSISPAKLGQFAPDLAQRIAFEIDPVVRAEVLDVCTRAAGRTRVKVGAEVAKHVDHKDAVVREATLDGLRALQLPIPDEQLVKRLADPSPRVRAAAARSILPSCSPVVGAAAIACLVDDDPIVRIAALDAVARCQPLHRPSLVKPLIALLRRHDGDTRSAIYLLGKLRAVADDPAIIDALRDCVAGPRSDVARAAALVLGQLGAPAEEAPLETRLLRAARELAAPDRDTQLAGLFEATRLGPDARSLVPAIRRLGDMLAVDDDEKSRATLSQVRDVLTALDVPAAELPRTRHLEPWRGNVPRERSVHGAYAIASAGDTALGLWDHATGALLFVVEGAELLELLHGRAEAGVIRTKGDAWFFERYAVPAGERLASLAIPQSLTHGWPSSLATAANIVTVWCGDEDSPYRFHIKLGVFDVLLDVEPNVERRKPKRGSTRLPRSKRTS